MPTRGSVPESLVHLPKQKWCIQLRLSLVPSEGKERKMLTFLGRCQALLDTGKATGWACVSSGLWVCSGNAEGWPSSQQSKMQ